MKTMGNHQKVKRLHANEEEVEIAHPLIQVKIQKVTMMQTSLMAKASRQKTLMRSTRSFVPDLTKSLI